MRHSDYIEYPISSAVLYLFKLEVVFNSFPNTVFILQSVLVRRAVILVRFISALVILLASLVVMVQFSLTYNEAGSASVLYNFISFVWSFLWPEHVQVSCN
jgi:hypothetical protein